MREPAATVSVPALRSPFSTPVDSSSTRDALSMLPSTSPPTIDGVRANAAGQLRAGVDRQIALDVNVALEPPGEPNVSGAFDLTFDRDVGADHRLTRVL